MLPVFPDPTTYDEAARYLLMPGDRYELLAIVINLTGQGQSARRMGLGDTEWTLVPREVNVADLDAGDMLEEIAAGRTPRELLALIPLMQRGGEDGIISRWREVVDDDTDLGHRGDYSLAVVFSDAVGLRGKWEPAIKGLNMIESPLVREWKDAARVETKVDAVVRLVKVRYKGAPEEVTDVIRRCRDQATLDRWFDVAATVDDLAEFRRQTGL